MEADCPGGAARALAAIQANYADKAHIMQVGANDIQVGTWDISKPLSRDNFVPGCSAEANAVMVRTFKTDTLNNPVSLGFAKFFYGDSVSVWAEAIAYTGRAAALAPGCALPVALPHCSDSNPDAVQCPYTIEFTPDNDDNSAWHTFNIEHANANCIKYMIGDCRTNCPGTSTVDPELLPSCPSPAEIYVNNGEINSALQATWDKFNEIIASGGGMAVENPAHLLDPASPNYSPYPYAWLTQILILSCGEASPCTDPPGTITDWKAVQTLSLKAVRCFKVTDVMASGRKDPYGRDSSGTKYIRGCVVPNEECHIMAPPEGPGPPAVLPRLVWTDSNYIAKN
jgi:hypothetical protein